MAFAARRIDEPDPRTRFPVDPTEPVVPPGADVTGIWRMDFDLYGTAKGVFEQQPSGVVTGSIEVPTDYGDLRFLAGNVVGERLLLSTFDGQKASYVEGDVAGDDAMQGVWIYSTYWDGFSAERVDDFEVMDPLSRVRYTRGNERFDLPALRHPKYAGKAVIVQIFATWCPNCGDHAPVLAELYRAHNMEGLEILGLAFEYTTDPEYSERRVREFRDRHGVEWDIVVADSRLEDLATDGLAGLSPIEGVPVTVFVNRDGTVHAVYTGFAGPAAAEAHERAVARFRRLTAEIIAGG
jgi:thiol-disulfide isomerase/thioredoxin